VPLVAGGVIETVLLGLREVAQYHRRCACPRPPERRQGLFSFELKYDDHHSQEPVMPESAAAILPTPEQVLQALLTPHPPRAPAPDWNSP
jgi:hypothetical protein